jgi:hypothetical protein
MCEEDKTIRGHHLRGSTALDLIQGETNGNAAIEKSASLAKDISERGDGTIGAAGLHKKPRLVG